MTNESPTTQQRKSLYVRKFTNAEKIAIANDWIEAVQNISERKIERRSIQIQPTKRVERRTSKQDRRKK